MVIFSYSLFILTNQFFFLSLPLSLSFSFSFSFPFFSFSFSEWLPVLVILLHDYDFLTLFLFQPYIHIMILTFVFIPFFSLPTFLLLDYFHVILNAFDVIRKVRLFVYLSLSSCFFPSLFCVSLLVSMAVVNELLFSNISFEVGKSGVYIQGKILRYNHIDVFAMRSLDMSVSPLHLSSLLIWVLIFI